MKIFADFFPVILFFIAYKLWDMYAATAVLIIASLAQIGWNYWFYRKVETMHWVTLVLVLVFGGLTLLLQDPVFIKWKPTVVNWLFALAFLLSGWFMQRSFLQRMMDHAIELPDSVWKKLNLAWVGFFFISGLANLYVAYAFSEEAWVNFKLFGLLGLTIIFVLLQGFYLMRYIEPIEDK